MNVVRGATAVLALAAVTACGSASDAVTFTAPAGFVEKASIGPFVQVWAEESTDSAIVLTALPTKMDLHEAVQGSGVKGAQIDKEKMITICGNQSALYADLVGGHITVGTGKAPKPMRVELVATVAGGKSYVAVYTRPVKAPANTAAEAAIEKLCPK